MTHTIFLSASVPDPRRNPKYYETADVTAIREAVRALATLVLQNGLLVWGGHPAITPMIRVVAESLGASITERIVLYQSAFFAGQFPASNDVFERILVTPKLETREDSLALMRQRMLSEHTYTAGVFIGGMEGVEEEFELFRELQPTALALPVASTGGAAKLLFNKADEYFPEQLQKEYSYLSLFRKQIGFDK